MTDVTAQVAHRDFRRVALVLKRGLDVSGALLGLLIAAPLFALFILANAAKGTPSFFVQRRIGKDGRQFDCLKFRSMQVGAEAALSRHLAADPAAAAAWDHQQKLAVDPRVSRIGRFIRRWGIDEVPQLINVLRGDMSLVGPRPVVAPDEGLYGGDVAYAESPEFSFYQSVRPGITGLWQVDAAPGADYGTRRALDRRYVDEWSLSLDLKILCRTPEALIRRRHG